MRNGPYLTAGVAQCRGVFPMPVGTTHQARIHRLRGRYRAVMQAVWSHPYNDQRPAVLDALSCWCPPGQRILDIGTGAGYYLPVLRPQQVMAVEPDAVFRRALQDAASVGRFPLTTFESVGALRGSYGKDWDADLVLVIHALYYLEDAELLWLLPRIGQRDLILVYPDPAGAITVAFEDAIGVEHSRRRLAIKERILGEPDEVRRVGSHFRLQGDTRPDDLAFLVAHLSLRVPGTDGVLAQALAFVADRIGTWHRQGFFELPQPQIMEIYRCPPACSRGALARGRVPSR
jgi:hypothetical protein